MADNGSKKYDSVRRAIKEIKEQQNREEEIKKTKSIQAQVKESIQTQQNSDTDAQEAEEKTQNPPIDDENLYESTDSTYDSLFLTKSVIRKAEESAIKEMHKSAIKDEQGNLTPHQWKTHIQESIQKMEIAKQETKPKQHSKETTEMREIDGALLEMSNQDATNAPTVPLNPPTQQKILQQKEAEEKEAEEKVTKQSEAEKKTVEQKPPPPPSSDIQLPPQSEGSNGGLYQGKIKHDKSVLVAYTPAQPAPTLEWQGANRFDINTKSLFTERHFKILMGTLAVLTLLILFSIFFKNGGSSEFSVVHCTRAEIGDLKPCIVAPGVVMPEKAVSVYSQVGGHVMQILCKEGAIIRKGDTIVRIYNPDIAKNMEIAQLTLSNNLMKYKESALLLQNEKKKAGDTANSRTMQEFNEKFLQLHNSILSAESKNKEGLEIISESEKIREQIQSQTEALIAEYTKKISTSEMKLYYADLNCQLALQEFNLALLNYAKQKKDEQRLSIFAPCDGTVYKLNVSPGISVQNGSLIVMIAQTSRVVEMEVQDVYFPYLQKCAADKMDAQILLPALTNKNFAGNVISFGLATGKNGEPVCSIKVSFVSKTDEVVPGLKAFVEIPLPPKQCVCIPRSALLFKPQMPYPVVLVVKQEAHPSIHPVMVIPGMSNHSLVEVVSGLQGDETVVTGCDVDMAILYEGQKVNLATGN